MKTIRDLFENGKPKTVRDLFNEEKQISSWADVARAGKQSEPEEESNIILDALDSVTRFTPPRIAYDIATSAVTPLLGGIIAETAGNALQALGDPDRTLAARYEPNLQKLRGAGDYAQEIADDLLQAGLDKVKPADNDTYSGALKNAFQRGAYGVLQGDASMIRSDKSANALAQAIQQLQDENPIEAELSLDYLTNPHGMTRDFGNVTGSMAAILPAMLAMPESVAARGAAKLGGDALTRYLINQGRYGAAKQFARRAPEIFRYSTTSAPAEGIAEGGHVRADALEQGLSEEEATQRSIDTMLANAALLTGTNTLEGFLLGAPNIASSLGRKAMQGLARGGLNMGVQGTEEALQKAISNANTDKPYGIAPQNWTPDQWQEFKAAFGGTAPMAFVAGAGHMASRPNTNEQNWNRGSQRDISNEDYKNIAQNVSDFKLEDDLRSWADKISGGKMSDKVFNSILYHARKNGIPAKIALAQATAESNGDQNVTSEAGAIGVMQLLPETAEGLGVDPYDQEQNIRGGMKYLKDMYDQFGDWNLALAAYNAGAGTVQKYGGIPNYSETQKYVAEINGYLDESPYYNDDVNNNARSTGIHYLGDNGKGEGNTWQRQNGNVSLDGVQPDLLNAIDVLGKWFYDRTGKRLVVTAGTNGKHAGGEHSHAAGWKVDVNDWDGESDGYLVNADRSKGSLTDEFIKFGQSIGLGMNWEGDHIDVALDGNQWADENGNALDTPQNFGGFNPRKTANNQSSIQPSQQQQQPTPPKPLFDINREDNQAQDIFKQFAEEKALNSNTNEEINFFDGMFDADGIFQNTKENRDAIRKDYADEFISFAQNTISAEQPQQIQPTQPAPIQSPKVQAQPKIKEQKIDTTPENPLLNNDNLKDVMVNYLNGIDKNLPENADFALEIGKAWGDGKYEKVKQMLEGRGISTTPNQSDPITQNKPPENVLPKSKAKLSGQEKLINTATKAVPVGNNHITARKKQGKALTELATQNNIEIPQPEIIALRNGSTKAVQKWRDELLKSGLFNAPQAQVQETPQQGNSQMRTPQENSTSAKILQARKARTEQENKARAIASRLLNMSEADESFVKRESPKQSKTPYESWEDLSELSREHDITGTSYEKELQQRQAEEERQRQWKAKQDRELAELKARQAENKRLAEMRHKMDEEKVTQQAAEEKQRQVENIQSTLGSQDTALQRQTAFALSEPSANKQEREKQGNALLNLLERPEIKYAISDSRIVNSLKPSLKVGAKPAILKAQEILNGIEAPEQQVNRPAEKIRGVKSPIQLEQERRQREQKKQQRQWKLAQRREDEEIQQEIEQEEDSHRQKAVEQDEFEDELQFESEMQETKMRYSEELEDLFGNQEKPTSQVQEQPLTQEEIDKRLSQLGQISQEEADEYLNGITKQIQPQSQSQAPKKNSAPQVQEQPQQENATKGKTAEVLTDNRAKYPVTYKVIEAEDLNASHSIDETGNVVTNEKFPAELQPRDRNRAGYRDTVLNRANNLDPEQLGESENVNQGAPVTRNDGVVLNGNGRVMAIRRAYETGKGDNYKNSLIQNAEKYGLNSEKIAAMKNPVLVRELGENLSAEDTENIIGSKQGGEKLSPREQAKADAQKISTALLAKAPQNGDLSSNDGLQFVTDVINTIATPEEKNSLMTSDGTASDAAVTRVKDALFTMAYGDNEFVDNLTESAYSDTSKTITTAMRNAAPKIAQTRAKMRNGEINQVDLSPITNAAQTIKSDTVVLKDLITPALAGFDSRSNEEKDILGFFNAHKSNPNEITKFLNSIADNLLSNKKGGMFEDTAQTNSLANAIANARQQVEGQEVTQQQLQNQAMRNQIAAQLHSNLKTKNNPSLKAQINGLIKDAAQGDNEALRIINRIKGNAPSENDLFAENSTPSKSDKNLDAKAKNFFEKFERRDNQGKPLIGATLQFRAFPTPEDVEKSAPITDGVDGIAKKYGGRYGGDVGYGWNYHFKTTEDRDNFIRSVMNSGVLETEIDRQQKAIQEREKAVTEYKNKVERIINGAKEKAYEILEADKYPEIKSFVDRSVQNAIQSNKINTVEKAEDLVKRIVPSIKKYKETGQLPKGVLWELWRNKYGDPNRVERKYKAKFETADKIIKQVEDGKLPLEKAYEDVKHFLETGRRKKETANPKSKKVDTQSEKQLPQTTEEKFSIRQWNANKAILKNALEKSKGLPQDRKEYFSFLLKLADVFERNHPTSDKSWQNGEKLRDTSAGIQVNVENIAGYNKEERGSDDVRGWLNAATFNFQGDVHYTGTHDLDKLSASPYGIAKLIERAIKYSHSHIDSKTLPTDAKNYFDLYQEDIRKQSEIAAKENSTESKIESLKTRLEATKEVLKSEKEKLKRWQKEEDPETRERWVTYHNKEIKYWQDKVQYLKDQLGELQKSKSSKQGKDVDTTIKNYVDQKDLTSQQKFLQDFGRKLGVRVIFFKGDSRFHGQHSNGITYLNVDSNMPLGKVFWHESMHWLKANNSKLYQQLAKAVGITNEQRQAYLDRTELNDLDTGEAIDEEIIADQFEDVAKRSGLLQSISGKNRGLIERVIQWLQDTMKKFVDYFRNPQGKLTTAQAQALADEFGKIANGLVDSNGEQIFRYNRRTHNVELANGRDWNSSVEHSDNRGAFSLQPKYSIDASDNSNESTLQRIRNKISAFIGSSDAPSKRRNKRITQFLEKLADIRIVAGHIKGAKNIDVDEFHRLLKSRKAYDWENILPEIGGMLAKSLNLNDSPEMRNYFTDWLLTGAPNNNSAEAKEFQQAARNNPAMFELLQNIRNEFDEIQNLSAEEFYGEKIIDKPPEKTLAEHLGYYKDNWKEEFIDDLHPINRMFEQVVAKAEKTNPKLAKWLKETVNPYEMARLFRGIDSVAEIMIGKIGTSPSERINEIRANLAQAFPNVNFSRFKPIAMILEEVGALNDKKTRKAFESYCVAKLDKEMHEKKKGDPEKYGYLQPLGTEEQADAMIAKYEKQFGQAQKDLVLYSNTMLTIMYDAGVLTKNKYSEILHSWKNYIPTARVFDENEEYDFVDSFKQKTGSNRDVWSPLQKMIANTTSLIKQAERNKVKCQIAQLARCGQFGQIIAETDNPHPNTDTAVSFYEFGKKHWLETPDTSIVRALSAIQSQKGGAWIVKAFNLVMSWFKGLQTFWNPDFSAGNIFRDSAAAYIHNKHLGYANPFMFFADVARIGFKGFWTKDANWIEWEAMGGAQSSYVSEDVDYVQRSISDITESGLESFKKHPFSYLLDRLQYIAEASETATRLTTYVKARDALAAQRSDGKATLDDKRHAALASRNATIDFAKAGTSTRKANRVFAFANAAVQDFALQFQTFSPPQIRKAMKGDKQAQRQIFSAGVRLLLMGVMPTVLQFVLMHRDDEKKKIYSDLHDWEKETYWYFGDLVHIPKSMDIGIRMTSAIIDELLKTAVDKDPVEWRRFRRLILDAAPGLTATLFTPLIETYANYSLFRDAPIVPAKEQHLPGHLQYGYNTSPVAKIISDKTIPIAKIFGAETGFSPRKIDYLISGYLGFMGRFFTGGTDELPIARRFVFEPYKNPKIVKDYYEALDEQASLYNGYKLELQQGKKVKPPEDFDPALYQRLRVAQESMRKLSNLEKRIQEDEKLSDNQRKEKLRELELRRVALCEKVFNKAR